MSQTDTKTDTATLLKQLVREVKELRRDVARIVPTETIDVYKHPQRILASYRRATRTFPARSLK